MTRTLAALLCLAGSAHAAPDCQALAEIAFDVAESREAGIPPGAIASHYLAQLADRPAEQRRAVERVVRIAAEGTQKPDEARHRVYLKCKAGEFTAPKGKQ